MPGFNQWDLGQCNCGCDCWPCDLAAYTSGLTLHFSIGGNTGTYALAYLGNCIWQGCSYVFTSGGVPVYEQFTMVCAEACTYVTRAATASPTCSGITSYAGWESAPGCSGIAFAGPLYLIAPVCSPLSLHFDSNAGGGGNHWIVTP